MAEIRGKFLKMFTETQSSWFPDEILIIIQFYHFLFPEIFDNQDYLSNEKTLQYVVKLLQSRTSRSPYSQYDTKKFRSYHPD